jgi:hypothetical protein
MYMPLSPCAGRKNVLCFAYSFFSLLAAFAEAAFAFSPCFCHVKQVFNAKRPPRGNAWQPIAVIPIAHYGDCLYAGVFNVHFFSLLS